MLDFLFHLALSLLSSDDPEPDGGVAPQAHPVILTGG